MTINTRDLCTKQTKGADIISKQIRLIGEQNETIGVIEWTKAQALAEEQGLDLVATSATSTPPVYKMLNADKHRFEQQKKEKERKTKQRQQIIETKEVRLSPSIGEHDYQMKVQRILKFLEAGKKVKVSIRFRGRMITHKEVGEKLFQRLMVEIVDAADVTNKPKLEGNQLLLFLQPKNKA